MLILLTNALNKSTFALRAGIILVVERDPSNPMKTRVVTQMSGSQGMVAYSVMESPEEVAALIAKVEGKVIESPAKPVSVVAS